MGDICMRWCPRGEHDLLVGTTRLLERYNVSPNGEQQLNYQNVTTMPRRCTLVRTFAVQVQPRFVTMRWTWDERKQLQAFGLDL